MIKLKKEVSFTLHINNQKLKVRKIGRGRFAKVYTDSCVAYAFVKDCQMKEAIALWGDTDNPHVPKIKSIGELNDTTSVYQMPIYYKLTASNKIAWTQYRELQKIWWDVHSVHKNVLFSFCDKVDESPILTQKLKDAVRNIIECGANYGDTICIEIAQRNLMVDDKENLILLDILFDSDLLPL